MSETSITLQEALSDVTAVSAVGGLALTGSAAVAYGLRRTFEQSPELLTDRQMLYAAVIGSATTAISAVVRGLISRYRE